METVLPRRRKSQGSIRSPLVKRDNQSQVVIEGWLHKLEGSALKQWKHRWCVLADFCLFSYKGPGEDKVSSSVLLPSYKISPCASEDKISRKFAFKAEHQNMKTYYFAAENKEHMKRWMNAMSLASIMQKFSRCEMPEVNILSSTSNDDEDSGFTSYRSRRYGSHDPNSTFDGSYNSEPLHQRSSSYGDRVGEMYLSSDDKYPNAYKNNQSHLYKALSVEQNAPLRQPLYANAPPKPRRLTQSDPFAISPGEQYDNIGYDNLIPDFPQGQYQDPDEFPGNYSRTPQVSSKMCQEEASAVHYDGFSQSSDNSNMKYICDAEPEHKVLEQPPRPHSADFLERDEESYPTTRRKVAAERTQPQRPKSSLECYNRYWDAEECGFYDYREAVRTQADHFYMNNRNRHGQSPYNRKEKDVNSTSGLRHSAQCIMEKTPSAVGNEVENQFEVLSNDENSHNSNYCDSTSPISVKYQTDSSGETVQRNRYGSKKKTHEESMKRLIEWKQRMLQSPLSKRSVQNSSSSSDMNSPQRAPIRPPLPNEYKLQVLKELENHEARLRTRSLSNDRSTSGFDVNDHLSPTDSPHESHGRSYSLGSSYDTGKCGTNIYIPDKYIEGPSLQFNNYQGENDHCSEAKEFSVGSLHEAEKNKKLMYCVDAENNEILISYEATEAPMETSHTAASGYYIHKDLQSEYATSLKENELIPSYDQQKKIPNQAEALRDVKESYSQKSGVSKVHRNSLGSRGPFHGSGKFTTCYSSDDEDKNEMESRQTRRPTKAGRRRNTSGEVVMQISKEELEAGSTPDYVNIKMVTQTWSKVAPVRSLLLESDDKCLGKGVSENYNTKPNEENHQLSVSRIASSTCPVNQSSYTEVDKTTKIKQPSVSNCYSEMDKELDMKREDYYRASQLFYPLSQAKREGHPSSTGKVYTQHTPSIHPVGFMDENYDNQAKQSIKSDDWNLDKDIGLPLPSPVLRATEYNIDSSHEHYKFSEVSMKVSSKLDDKIIDDLSLCNSEEPESGHISTSPLGVPIVEEHSEYYAESSPVQKDSVADPEKEKWKNPAAFANLSLVKKNVSFEEMRLLRQQQREAPPPNIVQERIKRFESAKDIASDKEQAKIVSKQDVLPKSKSVENFSRENSSKYGSSGKKSKRRSSDYGHLQKRYLHSDSETAFVCHSDDSLSDSSLTMKSAPILLSPLSSVLADLRKTADNGDKTKHPDDQSGGFESINSLENNDFPLRNITLKDSKPLSGEENQCFNIKPTDGAKKKFDIEEEAYLPMCGIKSVEEPEYVAMDDSKLGSSVLYYEIPSKEISVEDEPLYNEPFLPPPSFLHDVYEKQKTKHIPFDDATSSSDDMSENIYEKPKHWLPASECQKQYRIEAPTKNINPENHSLFLSNDVPECNNKTVSPHTGYSSNDVASTYAPLYKQDELPYSETYSSVPQRSVPDLLQLQEIKHSDASDADDEASRDFDTSINLHVPSYQSAILDQCQNVEEQSILYKCDGHSSFDSEIVSFCNKEIPETANYGLKNDCQFSSSQDFFTTTEEYKELNRTFSSLPIVAVCDANSVDLGGIKYDSAEGKQIHFRKLRVYTKGKKPEGPKIYPVPFNLDERDVYSVAEFRSEHDLQSLFFKKSAGVDARVSESASADETKNISFPQENYIPFSDGNSQCKASPGKFIHSSPAPDVVPSDSIEDKLLCQKLTSNASRSPNSAPYYYSDLLPENGFTSNNLEVSNIGISVSPRSVRPMLNNVRDKSPASYDKGDIGKKVNNIQKERRITFDDDALSNASSLNYSAHSFKEVSVDRKSDFKFSLDQFQRSESKFIDAERNKYEAGHTLEKTKRSSSTLSYFKHRASTPDLKSTYDASEPVYENLIFEQNQAIHQRSCSLEGLCKVPEFVSDNLRNNDKPSHESTTDCLIDGKTSPIYENIEFATHSVVTGDFNMVGNAMPTSGLYSKEPLSNYTSQGVADFTVPMNFNVPNTIKKSSVEKSIPPNPYKQTSLNYPKNNQRTSAEGPSFSDDESFLDQHELRRVSEQHFFAKHSANKLNSKLYHSSGHLEKTSVVVPLPVSEKAYSGAKPFLGETVIVEEEVLQSPQLSCANDFPIANFSSICLQRDSDIDSSSFSSSSVDEASNDSECRNKRTSSRYRFPLDRNENVSDSEIQVKGPSHLKKLVKQSEGLTSKARRLSISAGDLLGKTHEELVLLLIQLRRNQSRISRAKDKCQQQLESEKQLSEVDKNGQQIHSHNANELTRQIMQLEKQYEVTRPLVNLVDNMVKLGSLYGSSEKRSSSFPHLDNAYFSLTSHGKSSPSSSIQESPIWSTLLKEEKDLQGHLNEIYHLDRGLRQETHNFSSLQQDKEMLEQTLHGMKNKILDHQDKPIELQKLRKQQKMIEKELSRVKRLLNHSAKKIEEATAKNDQLEQEILMLRQKIQQALKSGACEMETCLQSRADLEVELTRVQNVLEELANHRQEISNTVEKLRTEARSKVSACSPEVRASPTGVAGSAPLPLRKKQQSVYLETDLDTMLTRDLAITGVGRDIDDIPVYVNAEEISNANQEKLPNEADPSSILPPYSDGADPTQYLLQDISEADDRMKRFYGILPREKTNEIKTVRIVKRQSERRSRERDKKRVTYDDQSLVWVMEEPDMSSDDHLEIEEDDIQSANSSLPSNNRPTSIPLLSDNSYKLSGAQSAHERLFGKNMVKEEESDMYKKSGERSPNKRWKRRHYTVSGYQCMLDPQLSQFSQDKPRSRDDVDMERCLRTANTPDIVRSTIKKKEVFDERIFDRELGLPQKIVIPERYIEDEPEQLSASERLRRSLKAENIRKMLSETTTFDDLSEEKKGPPGTLRKKLSEEKRKRAHLLALNHSIAREVMERSKVVAANVYCTESQASP